MSNALSKAILWGTLAAFAYLGWEFGYEIARYQATVRALTALETCGADGDCERAWATLQAAKGAK